jgi:CheY-like chemotaxis protein
VALIAVVDDEPVLREVLAAILTAEGYAVRGFGSAQECLAAAEAGLRPRLVLVDLRLRGMSGAAFVRRLRETAWGRAVAVYVVSGSLCAEDYPPPGSIEGMIGKPFKLEELLDVAARHVGRSAPAHTA